jgi:hypothetical protein
MVFAAALEPAPNASLKALFDREFKRDLQGFSEQATHLGIEGYNDRLHNASAEAVAKINWVKWTVVLLLAGLILVTIAMVHSDNRLTSAIAMAFSSIGAAGCVVLIAAHNRPFTGEISVSPELLVQVMPKE